MVVYTQFIALASVAPASSRVVRAANVYLTCFEQRVKTCVTRLQVGSRGAVCPRVRGACDVTRATRHAPRDVLPDEMSHGGEREVRRAHGGARQQLRRPQQRKISGAGPQVQVQVGADT